MKKPTGHVLLSGSAKLPSNTAAQKLFDQLVVVVKLDYETGIVLDVDCTMATELGREFVCEIIKGYDLNRGSDGLLEAISFRYFGHLKKALLTAVKDIFTHYDAIKNGDF